MSKKLECPKGHKKIVAEIVNEEEGWINVHCATCYHHLYYNGA
jgi:hypothetical protein